MLFDLEQTLGPVPERQEMAFEAVTEIYGSYRAMLACLPRALLDQVSIRARRLLCCSEFG